MSEISSANDRIAGLNVRNQELEATIVKLQREGSNAQGTLQERIQDLEQQLIQLKKQLTQEKEDAISFLKAQHEKQI